MRKLKRLLPLCLCLLALFSFPCAAEQEAELPEDWVETLPEPLRERLSEEGGDAVTRFDLPFFADFIGETLRSVAGGALLLAGTLCGLLLLLALPRSASLGDSLGGGTAAFLGRFGGLAAALLCAPPLMALLRETTAYLASLRGLFGGFLPLMESILLAGGNPNGAAVSCGVLSLFCSLLDAAGGTLLLPLLRLCLALTLLSAISTLVDLRPIAGFAEGSFTFLCAVYMTVLLGVFGLQRQLAAGRDGVAARALRFVARSSLPIVGGSVSEAMRTVLGSLNLLKNLAGGSAVVALLLLTLPPLLRFFCFRLCFQGGKALAETLGLEALPGLLRGFSRFCDFCIAILAMFAVSSIFQLGLFLGTGFALE